MKIATLRIARPALLALILLAYAPEAYCVATLKIPLNFDSGFIRDCLLQQVFTEPGEQRTIVDEAGGCSRFVLARPQVEVRMRGLSITARGSARMGDMRQEGCSESFAWTGRVELAAEPWLDPATSSVALKITGCRVLDESGSIGSFAVGLQACQYRKDKSVPPHGGAPGRFFQPAGGASRNAAEHAAQPAGGGKNTG